MICSQALSGLRPITSTCRFGARLPIGLLLVLAALRTFGAPELGTATNFGVGVPVPEAPGLATFSGAVASATAGVGAELPMTGVTATEFELPNELASDSSGLPEPGL